MPARNRNHEYWVALVEEFETSRLSRAEFAKAKQIAPTTFLYWLYKIRKEKKAHPPVPSFVEVNCVQQSHSDGHVRLEFPNGTTLHFQKRPPPNELNAIIRALNNPC